MKKQFGTIAGLGVAFAVLNSWVAESASMLGPISLGGCVTLIWGCVAGALFTTILCAGVAEMASAFPNAGGPYHYTYMLSSESYKNFLVSFTDITFRDERSNSFVCRASSLDGVLL